MLLLLALLLLAIAGLLWFVRYVMPSWKKRDRRTFHIALGIGAALVLFFLLFRVAGITPAAVIGFLVALAALISRLQPLVHLLHHVKKKDQHPAKKPTLSLEEAADILGISPHATVSEIKAAHHRLIQKLHPDSGGSTALASQINHARDVLLAAKKDW